MTALALCGSGSQGAMEVGLYRALVELGVQIDVIVGTSVGAINGAAIAAGISPKVFTRLWRGLTRRNLLALNSQSLWKLIGADSLPEQHLPWRRFEDLRVPLIITWTDVQTGRPVCWREGRLLDAIMASVAMPGLNLPQVLQAIEVGEGGITDNLPISVAVAEGAETVIFMVCTCCERPGRQVHDLLPTFPPKSYTDLLHHAGEAHLIPIESSIGLEIDPLDFSHTDELIEQGYAAAMPALKDWLSSGTRHGGVHRSSFVREEGPDLRA